MYYLYFATALAVIVSFVASREKTLRAVKIGFSKLMRVSFAFLSMLVLVSIALFIFPEESMSHYLGGNNKYSGLAVASFLGSVALMPGFIAYPLCGILLKQGVPYMVLSAFTTTLMMVGVLTYPLEREYLGPKVTVMRNLVSLVVALVVALVTGVFFGEFP